MGTQLAEEIGSARRSNDALEQRHNAFHPPTPSRDVGPVSLTGTHLRLTLPRPSIDATRRHKPTQRALRLCAAFCVSFNLPLANRRAANGPKPDTFAPQPLVSTHRAWAAAAAAAAAAAIGSPTIGSRLLLVR
ncbi:unnamed protein product [Protopolystoma xenopodis]|uniref:Uncharacterized protein n=1 Tax=Protopolystoma xenopodis TaxID=117903 RepID=A0A3S5AI75_9PLAT|nr:unnamed protein product [Protopolystoma xenopodis]